VNYKVGDIVTVKAEVVQIPATPGMVEISITSNFTGARRFATVKVEDVDRLLERACPEEPERHAILRGKFGALWTHNGRFWVTSGQSWVWGREFLQEHGPFSVFYPAEEKVGV
jgi:hypothetical protein